MLSRKVFVISICLLIPAAALLPTSAVADGFAGPRFVIADTTNTEQSRGAAFDGVNYLVGIQGDSASHASVGTRLVSQSGELVGNLIATGHTGGCPFVAFDGNHYLLVYTDDANNPNDDIYGCFVSTSGSMGPRFPISQAAGLQEVSALVFDGTNYLVVWEDYRNDADHDNQCDPGEGTCTDIYGQFVSKTGTLVGSELPICVQNEQQKEPSVAFDGTRYFVTWSSKRAGDTELWDICGRFIAKSGIMLEQFFINQTPSPRYNPIGIAYSSSGYLVAWNKDMGPGYPNPSTWDIYARIVTTSGGFTGNEFPICSATGDQVFPGVSSDGVGFLVTWNDLRNDANDNMQCDDGEGTCTDIYARFVNSAGTPAPEFALYAGDGDQFGGAGYSNGRFFVIMQEGNPFVGTSDVYGMFAQVPWNVSVSPANGTLIVGSKQTFTCKFSDSDGYTNLADCRLIINTSCTGSNCVYARYDANANKFYVRNDTNTAWLGGFAPGTANVIENGYFKLYCAESSRSGSGNDLTVILRIEPKSGMLAKACKAWMYAKNDSGTSYGWQEMSTIPHYTFVPPNTAPTVGTLSPTSGTVNSGSQQTFTCTYSDVDGLSNLNECRLLINTTLNGANCIHVRYTGGKIYLRNDANSSWGTGGTPGGATVLENSYCKVHCASSSKSTSGTTLTVNFSIEPKTTMNGKTCQAWMRVSDDGGLVDGWDMKSVSPHFSFAEPSLPPTNYSLSPNSGGLSVGVKQTLRTKYSDPNGFANLAQCRLLINTALSGANCIHVMYDANLNKLYVRNDANTSWGTGYAPGADQVLENSYCKLYCKESAKSGSGTTLTVRWIIEPKTTMSGKSCKAWMRVTDDGGLMDDWEEKGSFAVPGPMEITWDPTQYSYGPNILEYQIMRDNMSIDAAPVKVLRDYVEIGAGKTSLLTSAGMPLYGDGMVVSVSYSKLNANPTTTITPTTASVSVEPYGVTHTYQVKVLYKLTTGTGAATATKYYLTPIGNTVIATAIEPVRNTDVISPAYDPAATPPEIFTPELQSGFVNFEWNRKQGANIYYVKVEPIIPGSGPTWQSGIIYETAPVVKLSNSDRLVLANALKPYSEVVMKWRVFCRHEGDSSSLWIPGEENRFVVGNFPPGL